MKIKIRKGDFLKTKMRRNNRRTNTKNKKANISTIVISVMIVVIFILIILALFRQNKINSSNAQNSSQTSNSENTNNSDSDTEKAENNDNSNNEPINFKLTAIGDTLCHNTQYWDAYDDNTNTYDFSYVYEDIKKYTQDSDITIGSLETTFAGEDKGYSNYPTFNSPDSLAQGLKDIGVDIISTAGNHALDYGYDGLCRTIDVLDNVGISHLGTYKSAEDQNKILIKDVKGVKIAFLNYTYGTNGIEVPADKQYCVNLINQDFIYKQIKQAKEEKADIIVACMHWGTEYRTIANNEQKELANYLFENGVDIIIGNHPHVLEQMEHKKITLVDGTEKDVFVAYALGNFTADQTDEITRDSAILNLDITKNSDGKISINNINYVPIYMYKNPNVKKHKFKILNIVQTLNKYESGDTSISSGLYNNLKIQLEKIENILGDNILKE